MGNLLVSCPVCGSELLKPLSAGKTIYLVQGSDARTLEKSRAYSCGSNEHIVIIPAEENRILQISETHLSQTNGASPAQGKKRVLNSWKEIATYMGRGV